VPWSSAMCGGLEFGKENNPHVSNQHAYPVQRQNNAGGIGECANAARNNNPYSDPHLAVVEGLVDTLSRRHIGVVGEEFAVSKDGMEMFGVIDLETSFDGCRFAIGIRNANNKRFRLSCTVGLRVFVCHNFGFRGTMVPSSRNTRKTFRSKTAYRLAWTGCNGSSNRCGGRWKAGAHNSCRHPQQS
jgi:hypothetical protein